MFDLLTRLWARPGPAGQKHAAWMGAPFVALDTAGKPAWTPKNYEALAREGFGANPIAFRCVRMIAEAAASVPLLLYQGSEEVDTHPLIDLFENPNTYSDQSSLLEAWYSFLQLSGNAYMEAVSIGDRPVSLHVLRPDRMRLIPDARGWPKAYLYKHGTAERRYDQVTPKHPPILHLTLFNPTNDHYGMSPIEAAAVPIDVHNASSVWSKALLDNAARPSGALVYHGENGAHLSDQQFDRLKSDLAENFAGSRNAGRPLLLEGGLDWKPLSFSAQEMDFLNTKNTAAREIALAFGVPPMLLGIPGDNTYSNYREANLAFWRQTVLPLVQKTARCFTKWLARRWADDLRLAYDLDQVSALTVEREALWQRLNNASFLTDAEKREAVGYSEQPQQSHQSASTQTGLKSVSRT